MGHWDTRIGTMGALAMHGASGRSHGMMGALTTGMHGALGRPHGMMGALTMHGELAAWDDGYEAAVPGSRYA